MKVHPVLVNLDSARKHYKNMAEGKQRLVLNYNRLGKIMVGRGNSSSSANSTCDPLPQVELVTPTAMAADQARAKIKQRRTATTRRKRNQSGGSRKKQPIRRKPRMVQKKQKKKKKSVKKVIRGRVTKRRAQSQKGQRRDNFS